MRNIWRCAVGAAALTACTPARALDVVDCVDEALKANPSLEAMEQRVEAAAHAIEQARSAYWPRAYAGGALTRTDNPAQAFMMDINQRRLDMGPGFDPNQPDDTQNLRLGLGFGWRLWDGGVRGAVETAARWNSSAEHEARRAVRNRLIFEVVRGYYEALRAVAFVEVRQDAVRSLETSLKVARDRFDAGAAVRTDVLNLEVQLAQAVEDAIQAENAVRLAVLALNTSIGSSFVVRERLPAPSFTSLQDMTPCTDTGVPTRPELARMEALARAASATLDQRKREGHPTLDALLSADWDSEDGSSFENSYTAGVAVRWDFFTAGERSAARQRAAAELKSIEAERAAAALAITFDVERARIAFEEAASRIDVASKALDSAQALLEMTRDQYRQGARTLPELVLAESGVTATRTRYVSAWFDIEVARADVLCALGRIEERFDAMKSRKE